MIKLRRCGVLAISLRPYWLSLWHSVCDCKYCFYVWVRRSWTKP